MNHGKAWPIPVPWVPIVGLLVLVAAGSTVIITASLSGAKFITVPLIGPLQIPVQTAKHLIQSVKLVNNLQQQQISFYFPSPPCYIYLSLHQVYAWCLGEVRTLLLLLHVLIL